MNLFFHRKGRLFIMINKDNNRLSTEQEFVVVSVGDGEASIMPTTIAHSVVSRSA